MAPPVNPLNTQVIQSLIIEAAQYGSRHASASYLSYARLSQKVFELRQARNISPPPGPEAGQTWRNCYISHFVFTIGADPNYNPNTFRIKHLPWTDQEFATLKTFIPHTLPGGESNTNQYQRADGKPNWLLIGDAMDAIYRLPVGEARLRYSEESVRLAHKVRILPEANARLAAIQRPPGSPAVLPPPAHGHIAPAGSPRAALHELLASFGQPPLPLDFEFGVGWRMEWGQNLEPDGISLASIDFDISCLEMWYPNSRVMSEASDGSDYADDETVLQPNEQVSWRMNP